MMLVSLLSPLLHLLSTHSHLCKTDGDRQLLWDMGFNTWLPRLGAWKGSDAYVAGTVGKAPERLPLGHCGQMSGDFPSGG